MKRSILVLILIMGFSVSTYAITDDEESKLLFKVISAGATTPEQKSITQKYIASIIDKKQKEADKYRELANQNSGGKHSTQRANRAEYLKKAAALDNLAKEYLAMAESYSNIAINQ